MTTASTHSGGVLTRGMIAVLCAQFFSAFGDNALLFVTVKLIKTLHYPAWSEPVLQMAFVAAYILLAPFVGQVADGFAKGRVMMISNGLKLVGAAVICLGGNAFAGYALVGVGAAIYSPAKYGILGELTSEERLVKANGLIEASTIAAILLGALIGGYLADKSIVMALWMCVFIYGCAVIANFYIPRLKAAKTVTSWSPKGMSANFFCSCKTLWQDSEARFSLIGTGLFWGAGIVLRFLLIAWVPVALGIVEISKATELNGITAIGIVLGAAAAAKLVKLETVKRCLPAGVLMGVLVAIFCIQNNEIFSYLLLIVIGVMGGFFVVPMNALLQERGKLTVGAGNAIAVQNLGENTAMLLMLGLYSLAIKAGVPVVGLGVAFGALFAISVVGLWIWKIRQNKRLGALS